jgi:PleD family two-component response regulator
VPPNPVGWWLATTVRDPRKHDVVISVTVAAGVAEMRSGDNASSWVGRADGALYRSRQKGRDRVTRA